ncbi:hypothetical protein P7H00_08825 [Enterococcus pseudoavium]|uniref:Lipoprotein n=1 Tax=Enterococcus pseudoavium TaxID=44007 RepID=A0AAE4I3X0_9ENTE|nr:hypothetical protein [Enterococcus pseudoavium]MDT2737231.1 hypothetical protein [Enterococcus pseudoavium]
MKKKILCFFELFVIILLLLGCARQHGNARIEFDAPSFKADGQGKVKVSGVLKNGEQGSLKANINTKNTVVRVKNNGKFDFYYDLKNIKDDRVYLGIESRGIIIGNEIKIEISSDLRDSYLLSGQNIVRKYKSEGYTVLNSHEMTNQDLENFGLDSDKLDAMSTMQFDLKTESDNFAKVRIFTFNSSENLQNAYYYLLSKTRLFPYHVERVTNDQDINKRIPLNVIEPQVYQNYINYLENVKGMPLLDSWVYQSSKEDSGYVLIQQDATINSSIAGVHERIINDLLSENGME